MAKEHLDLQKHTLNFYRGDVDELRGLYPAIEPTTVIRELIHDHIAQAKANDPSIAGLKLKIKLPGVEA